MKLVILNYNDPKFIEFIESIWEKVFMNVGIYKYTLDQTISDKVEKGCRRLLSRYKKYS